MRNNEGAGLLSNVDYEDTVPTPCSVSERDAGTMPSQRHR